VHKAIREQLLPFARRQYPHLNAAFDKQPYPRPGNLFIVRYSAASPRPGGRGLKLHKDETALTFNMCLSPQDSFEGGGTYFPAASSDVDGILMRPTPGYCLVHDGNIKHAGNEVTGGDRYILVGFYNADGRDRAGEEAYFSKSALEEARQRLVRTTPPPVQTIYFTTAVASARGSAGAISSTQAALPPIHVFGGAEATAGGAAASGACSPSEVETSACEKHAEGSSDHGLQVGPTPQTSLESPMLCGGAAACGAGGACGSGGGGGSSGVDHSSECTPFYTTINGSNDRRLSDDADGARSADGMRRMHQAGEGSRHGYGGGGARGCSTSCLPKMGLDMLQTIQRRLGPLGKSNR